MFICGVPLTLHGSSSSQDHQGVAARPGRTPVRVLPLLSMLASARQPVHSWIGSGALAFSSPPRSLSAKDEPARATCPTAHACSSPLLQTPLPYLGTSPTRRRREIATIISAASASGAARRKVGLSCLRGGSAGADGDAPQAIPTATNPSLETEADGERQVQYGGEGGPMVFGGVALVTERSTATGGSEGRVSYSVLADGTLEVGRAEHKRKDSGSRTSPPPPTTPPPPLPSGTINGVSTNTETSDAAGTRKVLQELRRRTLGLKACIGKAAKGVAGEARIAAEGARGCVVRAGVAVRGGLMNTFLPAGYPRSVRPEYVRYRCWDIVQDLSSHLRGVLATQAVLEGMGVGRAGSTPLAATLQWMARDGASMVGGLLFTSAASANFGVNIKTWRLFADASNDVGLALEMLAPLPAFRAGGRFLQLICVASVFKAACGVAGGATGAAITEHWAVDNNIADVGAKNGAQHTVASLLGLGLSVWFARAVSQSDTGSASGSRVWGWYLALTVVHLLANYAAMRTLALRSLNPARASLLVTEYLGQPSVGSRRGCRSAGVQEGEENDVNEEAGGGDRIQEQAGVGQDGGVADSQEGERGRREEETKAPEVDWMGRRTDQGFPVEASVLSPFAAARREQILLLPGWVRALKPWGDFLQINVGVPVRALVREADDLLWLTSLYHDEKAMVEVQVSYKPLGARMETKVNLALREDASAKDRLQAMFQANVIHRLLVRDPDTIPQGGDGVDRTLFLRKVTEEALRLTRQEFPAFRQALVREGWDLSRVTLGGGPWVGRWGSLAKED